MQNCPAYAQSLLPLSQNLTSFCKVVVSEDLNHVVMVHLSPIFQTTCHYYALHFSPWKNMFSKFAFLHRLVIDPTAVSTLRVVYTFDSYSLFLIKESYCTYFKTSNKLLFNILSSLLLFQTF